VDKNKHMQSALPQSSLNQRLGVTGGDTQTHFKCSAVQNCKKIEGVTSHFLNGKIKRKQNPT
jgi:hypothetical protein